MTYTVAEMIRNWFLVVSALAFYGVDVTKADDTLLQKTIEHLVNYTALETLEQLDLDNIGNEIVDDAYKNYSKEAREFPRHCNDFSKKIKPPKDSRMTIIQPDDGEPFPVYCEMNKFGGGWTRILYRYAARMTFNRDWYSYKHGFGSLSGDGWLGLEKIHRLTKNNSAELLISLYSKDNKWYYPQYRTFWVGSEATKYQLHIANFTGDGGDSLSYSNNAKFSTYDQDHDSSSGNCASSRRGGWWYKNCAQGKLTGDAYAISTSSCYVKWPGVSTYAMRYTYMEIRPY